MEVMLPPWADWMRWAVEIITPLAAIALFVATLLLVNKTRIVAEKTADLAEKTKAVADRTGELVKETNRGTDQLDRHHLESLLPIVYVDAELTFARETRQDKPGLLISLKGDLVNVGPGPATSVNLLLKPVSIVERWFYQGLIGANSRRPLYELDWWIYPLPSFGFQEGQPWPFTVTTKYITVFDDMGQMYQHSHSGRRKDLLVDNWEKPTIRPRRLQEGSVSVSATAVIAPPGNPIKSEEAAYPR